MVLARCFALRTGTDTDSRQRRLPDPIAALGFEAAINRVADQLGHRAPIRGSLAPQRLGLILTQLNLSSYHDVMISVSSGL